LLLGDELNSEGLYDAGASKQIRDLLRNLTGGRGPRREKSDIDAKQAGREEDYLKKL